MQKIYFQPDVNLDLAISQIVAATSLLLSNQSGLHLLCNSASHAFLKHWRIPQISLKTLRARMSRSTGTGMSRNSVVPVAGCREVIDDKISTSLPSCWPVVRSKRKCGLALPPLQQPGSW